MNLSDADWIRLERYASRRGTPEELAELERWVASSPELQAIVRGMRSAGLPPGEVEPQWDADAAWHRVSRRLRWFSRPPLAATTRAPVWRRHPALWAAAAAVLLVLLPALLIARFQRDVPSTESIAPAMRVATTPRGQRAIFGLPDGSRVILAPGSTLRHSLPFTEGPREVWLEGEAYFEVEHDERRPFRVHAGELVAEDLGTEFVVRAYPGEARPYVVVREGEVGIADVVLHPGQLGRLDERGRPAVEPADTMLHFAWTQGRLAFDRVPLAEALPQLARWYDLEFRLAQPSIGRIPLTGTFADHPSQETLDLLAASLGLRAERRGQVVTLSRPRRER